MVRVDDLRLWPHQRAAYDTMAAYVRAYRPGGNSPSGLVHMPTGTGKTGVIAALARIMPGVGLTLVLSPRIALRNQLAGDLAAHFWRTVGRDPGALPKPVTEVHDDQRLPDYGDRVAVMTIQRLVRDADSDSSTFRTLRARARLLILDEGHAEPAPRWSEVVRAFDAPRILFTATPFRNDLKPFDIDFERYAFSYSFEQAVRDRVIRSVEIVQLPHPRSPAAFAQQLVEQYRRHFPGGAGPERPRVIVRCEDHDTIRQLCRALLDLQQSVIGVHERFPVEPDPERPHEQKRVPRREDRGDANATFWVHQYKLLEGIDEPRFQMVALYDPLRSTRAVIQQIGRVLRNPGRHAGARAVVLDHSGGVLARRWEQYLEFDAAVEKNPRLLAHDLTELAAESIAGALPHVAYVLGDFRRQLDLEDVDIRSELRFPRSTRIYRRQPDATLAEVVAAIDSEFRAADRVFVGEAAGRRTHVWRYIAVRDNPFLRDRYFLEPSFHVAVVHLTASWIFYTDSGGQVILPDRLAGRAVQPERLRRLLHEGIGHRLTRVTLRSANVGPAVLRSRALGAYALGALAPSFDDHLFVCQTAEGLVAAEDGDEGHHRYLGFAKARVSDGGLLDLDRLLAWFAALDTALEEDARKPMRGFARFAMPHAVPSDPTPVNILLDVEDAQELYEPNVGADARSAPVALDDLCHDVGADGAFTVVANGETARVEVRYDPDSRRYSLVSPELEERYVVKDPARDPRSIVRYLNEEQAFRVLPRSSGVVYAGGTFYQPLVQFGPRYDDGRLDLLAALQPVARLADITDEKGSACTTDGSGWERGCLFDLIARRGQGTVMATPLQDSDVLICDDMGTESADFIVANTTQSFVAFIHAKASAQRKLYSASALQEVVAQAQKNLRYAHPYEDARPQKCARWHRQPWTSKGVRGSVTSRLLIGTGTGLEVWEHIRGILKSPQARKEVWLVLGNMLSKRAFEAELRARSPAHEAAQAAYLLEGLTSIAMSLGVHVRVFCMP